MKKRRREEEGDRIFITKEKFQELAEEVEAKQKRNTAIVVAICALVALSMLAVLAKPDLLVWLVNLGVVSCAVVAGIALDRRWRS